MQPVIGTFMPPEGHSIPYRWATPGQHAQAVLWLAKRLQHHFISPAAEVWSQVFHEYQPDLWEDSSGIFLDHADLVRLAQRVAHALVPADLDPPIYCEAARHLAAGYEYIGRLATTMRNDLALGVLAPTPRIMAFIERMEIGKAVAERVLQATRG